MTGEINDIFTGRIVVLRDKTQKPSGNASVAVLYELKKCAYAAEPV